MNHTAAETALHKDQPSECDSFSLCSSEAEQDVTPEEQDILAHSPAARSNAPQKQPAAAAGEGSDQPYNSYKMSTVHKLVSELARKQRECRKAKLHAVVRLTSCYPQSEPKVSPAMYLNPGHHGLCGFPLSHMPPMPHNSSNINLLTTYYSSNIVLLTT